MPGHSNQEIKKHIDDNSVLLEKMSALTARLQTQIMTDFHTDMGVALPSAVEADVRELEYSMVYSSDPITDEYMNGAKTLLDGAFSGDWIAVANKALDVVQVLIGKVVGSTSIQTGAHSNSMKIRTSDSVFVSAAFTQIEECKSQDWLVETNFYVSFYIFVVWQPTQEHLDAIDASAPKMASAVA